MLTAEHRAEVMRRIESDAHDDRSAVNALLAAAFYFKGTVPVTEYGTHQFEPGGKSWDEHPGQLRGQHGWLMSPSYLSSIDDATDLVSQALGDGWLVEVVVRLDGSTARLHQFDPPCRKTGWHRSGPLKRGAATAIVKAVLEATA